MRFELHCSPCAVCGLPATHMDIGPIGREVVHGTAKKARRCPLPKPARPIEIKEPA